MKRFADLYSQLDATTSTKAKVEAMVRYFESAPPADAAWGVFLLSGRRFKRLLPPGRLREWALDATGLPQWLVEDSYSAVGDLAETVALLVGRNDADGSDPESSELSLQGWIDERILSLRDLEEDAQKERLIGWWRSLPSRQVFLLGKMLTGALRVGVSQTLTARALAQVAGVDPPIIHHRLMGHWTPSARFFRKLVDPDVTIEDRSRPFPFYLASPLDLDPEQHSDLLGDLADWQVEWKWDGIRGQLIRRGGETFLWSRGEELVTDRYPEIRDGAESLPDGTVLDGEILAWQEDRDGGSHLPFAVLQKRIGRKKPGRKILRDAPVNFLVYDLLESDGVDVRPEPLERRRSLLETRADGIFPVSPRVEAGGWSELAALRESSRERGVEGFMLKRLGSEYKTGRRKGDWWKWKVDPLTVDAVLLYAQSGHGKRATLLTDYTFAVWDGETLVPFAKAYSGLADDEIRRLDRWLRRNTRERFGPVRSVEPEQVFEIAFEGIRHSTRHKSGVAVRFPRIHRWREDLSPRDADTLESVKTLLLESNQSS